MDNCKEQQQQSHVRANYVVGNEYSDLVNVITASVPFIGYVRAANEVKILDEVVVAEGSVNSNSDATVKTETKTEAKSDVKSENKEETLVLLSMWYRPYQTTDMPSFQDCLTDFIFKIIF